MCVFCFCFCLSRILNKFYQEDGKMPGVPRRRRLPWTRTFPYFVFWMATLLPFVMTKWGRSAYWKMWLVTSFGSVSYMMFLFGKVQRWNKKTTHVCTLRKPDASVRVSSAMLQVLVSEICFYRVHTVLGKPGNSWTSVKEFSKTWKSSKKIISPGKT